MIDRFNGARLETSVVSWPQRLARLVMQFSGRAAHGGRAQAVLLIIVSHVVLLCRQGVHASRFTDRRPVMGCVLGVYMYVLPTQAL